MPLLPTSIDDAFDSPEELFSAHVRGTLGGISDMLIEKNAAYGDSVLNPSRIFSKAGTEEQLLVRIDDKLTRIQRGHEYQDDDTIRDLIGYLTLLIIARRGEQSTIGGHL